MRVAGFLKLMAIALSLASWPARSSWADGIAVEPVTFPCAVLRGTGTGRDGIPAGQRARSLRGRAHRRWASPAGGSRQESVAPRDRDGDGTAGRSAADLRKFPAETPKSSKWEGMARDSEGNYYLVGSYSGKTPGERDEHAKLIRFRLKTQPGTNGGLDAVAIDEGSVISWPAGVALDPGTTA